MGSKLVAKHCFFRESDIAFFFLVHKLSISYLQKLVF